MSEYKRLTERYIDKQGTNCVRGLAWDGEILHRLAELEDKIDNGTLVELPCKVGDMVYIPYKFRNKNGVLETIIEEIRIGEKHILFWAKPLYTNNSVRVKYLGWKKYKDFNKTWFLTKAEAEARLKELDNSYKENR